MLQQSRLRLLLAATFITSTIAQDLPTQVTAANPLATSAATFPTCATNCLAQATGDLPCQETDTRCLCAHQGDVRSTVETCLAASNECSAPDTVQAASYYERVCLSLGLDRNGEPSLAISSDGIATASNIVGLIPTSAVVSATTSASVTSASPTSTRASSNEEETNDKDEGLSVATVAGIAAGCAFIVVAIITALIWVYIRRRDEDDEEIESQPKKSSPEGSGSFKTVNRSEKDTEFAMTALSSARSQPLSSRSQPPSRGRPERKPSLAERRHRQPAHLARTPSENIKESKYPFPFGDKRGAEASVTSLTLPSSASKPVSAVIVQKSPIRSQLSDAGSIYSVSSINSEEAQMAYTNETRRSRPTTFYNLYQNGESNVDLPQQSAPSRGQGSLRKNKFNLQVSTPTLQVPQGQHSPNPFATPPASRGQQNPFTTPDTELKNPFESAEETISPQERPNPLRQNPNPRRSEVLSAGSFGKFDFEISQEDQRRPTRSLRDSFFNSLDLGFGKLDSSQRK